jgi:hypothetical protein
MSALARKLISRNAEIAAASFHISDDIALPAVDLLAQAIEQVRASLADETRPTKERVRLLWATAKVSRDLGASDVLADAFMQLAIDVNLIDQSGRWVAPNVRDNTRPFGREDIEHLIRWALRGWNPFEKGPLK